MKISKAKATDLIKNSQGKFLNVKFVKKNGDSRSLTGRLGVHKYTTGEGLKYNPEDKNLIGIYDNINKGYRMIPQNTISEVTLGGQTYEVS